jgi:hypothetical protein
MWRLAAVALAALRGPGDKAAYDKQDGASCSPRCAVQLDVVVVAESPDSSAVLRGLLPHFSFGPQRFALMDGPTHEVLAGFIASRPEYLESVKAWSSSDKPPASVEVLASKAAEALLPSARESAYTSLVILNEHTVSVGSLHGASKLVEVGDLPKTDVATVVSQLLPQVCPGLKIDPSMPCGPSRWGKAVEPPKKPDLETNRTWGEGEAAGGPAVALNTSSRHSRTSPLLF